MIADPGFYSKWDLLNNVVTHTFRAQVSVFLKVYLCRCVGGIAIDCGGA